jgi:hypothetical protein
MTVALAIFLVAGEVLARTLHVVDRLNGYSRLLFVRGPTPALPYVLRPGVATTYLGLPVHVNRLGVRGPEVERAPRHGVRRILVLGDSVVFGQGIGEAETVTAVLERRLNAAGTGAWEVLNAGAPGYDAVAEAQFLETAGLALEPSAVVVGTSLNDYDPAPAFSPLGILTRRDPRESGLADRSEFVVLLRWLVAWARGELWHQMTAPAPRAPASTAGLDQVVEAGHLRFYHQPTHAEWERLRGAFVDLARTARARGLPVLVAIFPERYQVGGAAPDLTPQRRLLELCGETALRCLDLQPAFAATGGDLFLDAQHPSARGLEVAAAAIAEELLARRSAGRVGG